MSNVLITSGGRRVSLVRAFKKELKSLIPNGEVYVTDVNPKLSAAAQVADRAFKICKIEDENYISDLLKLCQDHAVRIIIPTLDPELNVLAKNESKFKELDVHLVLSSKEFIDICSDKLKTHDLFESVNIDVAKVYDKTNYELPIFIKPKNGSNSVDTYIIEHASQISEYHLENGNLQFFEYFNKEEYDEYTCDLYFDKRSHLKCVIPRKRIEVRGGEVSKGVTCNNYVKTVLENKFKTLKDARGCICIQLFMNKDKVIKGIEINARFGGGFPLAYLAGGNYPKWIIQEYILNESINYFNDWEDNLLMLRYDDEIIINDYEN
ncbi:ATP-grasp domain-containing protein [Changchengzhania lutea]|uniref:ATP-grasp domain-containing protein n=1 Tax=Changchengzhania lutea TaxID=2049305 RepID=UPI00115DF394|nr:ATP-grasp domain-containing protein [Changchengzhania lutea]